MLEPVVFGRPEGQQLSATSAPARHTLTRIWFFLYAGQKHGGLSSALPWNVQRLTGK